MENTKRENSLPSKYGDNRIIKTSENARTNCFEKIMIFLSYLALLIFFPIAIFFCLLVVPEYKRVVILRLGRLRKKGLAGPGVCFYLPCIDQIIRVDLRTTSLDVPGQEVLTKDSVTISVDGIVYFRIKDPTKAVLQVVNVREATEYLAQTTLRTVIGTKMLIELLTSREQLSQEILHVLDEATDVWGVKVERVEISDISLPVELQRSMAAEQEALRKAKAKIAAADGELQSSYMLKEASDTMAQNPMALQLRYLHTLGSIATPKNHTIVVPMPLDIIKKFGQALGNAGGDGQKPNKDEPETPPASTSQKIIIPNEEPSVPGMHDFATQTPDQKRDSKFLNRPE